MAGIAVLDQKHAPQVTMTLTKPLQCLDIMGSVFMRRAGRLHTAAVHDQKQPHIDRPMTRVFKLLLLDRTGSSTTHGIAFDGLQIGHLIDADDPNLASHQTLGIGITPQNCLRVLLKLRVQARHFPVPRAMRLQIHLVQNAPHGTGTDLRHNALSNRLAGQILAEPMGDMQSLSERLQTRQLHNLGALQGKSQPDDLSAAHPTTNLQAQPVHSGDRCARQSRRHIASERPRSGHVHHWP